MNSTMKKTKTWSKPEIKAEMKIRETLGDMISQGPDNMQSNMPVS